MAKVLSWWSGLPAPRRRHVIAAAAVSLLVFTSLAFWALKPPPYVPVFARLSPADAAAVAEALGRAGIPFKVSMDGTSVWVPRDRAGEARVAVASRGVLSSGSSGPGMELFDRLPFWATQEDREVAMARAVAGELERAIRQMPGIEDARVILVRPKETVFRDRASEPTASVFVRAPGGLSASQVAAIRHLVAGAWEGLSPEKVTVVDESGRLLAAEGGEPLEERAAESRESEALTRAVQEFLDRTLGPGMAVAAVSVDLDFSKERLKEERSVPSGQAARESLEERWAGEGAGPAGPPGTQGATDAMGGAPTYPLGPIAGGRGEYQRNHQREQAALSRTEREVSMPPGRVRRISVAVAVDPSVAGRVPNLQELVAAAAGVDPGRGDSVAVVAVPLYRPAPAEPPVQAPERRATTKVPLAAALGLLGVAVVAFLFRRMRRRVPYPAARPLPAEPAPQPPPDPVERARTVLKERAAKEPGAVARVLEMLAFMDRDEGVSRHA